MTTKFERRWLDDEHTEFFVNGVQVGTSSYDSHGSKGMRLADQMFENIAAQVGAEVIDTEGSFDE